MYSGRRLLSNAIATEPKSGSRMSRVKTGNEATVSDVDELARSEENDIRELLSRGTTPV
jgi:hypothetical protein